MRKQIFVVLGVLLAFGCGLFPSEDSTSTDSTSTDSPSPTPTPTPLSSVSLLASGGIHTCVLVADGTTKCWGGDTWGALGLGYGAVSYSYDYCARWFGQYCDRDLNKSTPVSTTNLANPTSVESGGWHTCAVMPDKTVKCWGANERGQLGNASVSGNCCGESTPASVQNLANVDSLALGNEHSCALLSDKTVKCWGRNGSGQLGDNSTTQRNSPVDVLQLSNVSQLALGAWHTCALLSDKTVKCWGQNGQGQLGDGTNTWRQIPTVVSSINNASFLTAGRTHTCVVLDNGTVKCWGDNYEGALGTNKSGGDFYGFDSGIDSNTPVSVDSINNAVQIEGGERHTCVLLSDTTVKCWGRNSEGQLGTGATSNSPTPTPVKVSGLSSVEKISIGSTNADHSCALLSDKTVKCWGKNIYGQLGDGTTANKNVPTTVISN